MEVEVIKEENGRRTTDRNKMRERKKEIRKYEKKKRDNFTRTGYSNELT